MNDLSRGLQLICGSPPSSAAAGSTSPGRFPSSCSPTVFAFGDRSTPPLSSSNLPRGGLHRAKSVQAQGVRLVHRPVFVRHIETQAELSNRLVEICQPTVTRRTGSPVPSTAHVQTTTKTPPFPVLARPFDQTCAPSYSSSTRVRVRVAPHRAEDLIVSVREDGDCLLVAVEAVSGCSRKVRVLHQAPLPAGTQPRRLIADLGVDGVLSVRERASTRAEVTFNNVATGSVYLPVVRRDESSLELTIVLHVPRHFRFEDISVRTVDDRVVVMGKRRSFSPPGGAAAAFSFRSATSVLPTFRVSLQLPSGTDSRSVSALLTEHHQLVIRGTLGPLSRRNTL